MCELSIIVPVFNVEKWLPRCIDSIVNQTIFSEIEVLLIDDGSTDSSGYICDVYAQKYNNITVYHKINGGVSSARNFGLNKANGNYIAFVDSDDYVDNQFYESMLNSGKNYEADLVVGDYFLVFPNGKKKRYRGNTNSPISCDQNSALSFFLMGNYIGVNLFDKLFLKKTIGDIKFDENIKIGEDLQFIFIFLTRAKNIYCIFTPGYCYYQRNGSAMNSTFSEKNFDVIIVSTDILEWIKYNKPALNVYAKAMYIHSAYKTIERAYKSNCCEKYKEMLQPLYIELKRYKVIEAFHNLAFKQFIGFVLMRISPKFYIIICKICKI